MNCECENWCRDWRETQGGKYPISIHAPGCKAYKQKVFTRMKCDDYQVIVTPEDAGRIIVDSEENFEISTVHLKVL